MPAIGQPSDYNTGPSRDWKAIAAAEPVWAEEPFQINPRSLPVTLTQTLRPITQPSPISHIPMQRIPVSVRTSNLSPVEDGSGYTDRVWSLSDPGAPGQVAGLGDDYMDNAVPADVSNPATPIQPQVSVPAPALVAAAPANPWAKLLSIGAVVGFGLYILSARGRR